MANQHRPYYRFSSAVDRGARFGTAVGMLGAVGAIAMGTLASPGVASIMALLVGGAAAGWVTGGVLFGAGNLLMHAVPGLSHATGEDKSPTHLRAQQRDLQEGRYTNVTTPQDHAKMEEEMDFGNSDFTERLRLQQQALQGQNR